MRHFKCISCFIAMISIAIISFGQAIKTQQAQLKSHESRISQLEEKVAQLTKNKKSQTLYDLDRVKDYVVRKYAWNKQEFF